MNKRLFVISSVAVLLLVITAFSYTSTEKTQSYAILSVTSSVDGQEVFFDGKYFNPSDFQELNEYVAKTKTPFKVTVYSGEFTALFRKIEGEPNLVVQIEQIENGKSTGYVESTGDVSLLMQKGDWAMSTGL